MPKVVSWLCAGTVAALVMAGAAAQGGESKVELSKVPAPVMEAVRARFAGAEITGAGKEKEKGKQVYEVTIKNQGQNIDVTLTPAGEILLIEKEIGAGDLPEAVTGALEGAYPKATYRITEEIIQVERKQEKLAYYEVLLDTADKKKAFEVQVTAEGKVINVEKKKPGKDDA